ncbi:MAG: heat shock protein HspQ [Rhodospirillales bacterium]|nr:heat shock protein HspQ [Rhodospirillales bacterium]
MFFVGQIIHHKRFDYRGVVIDVDPEFHGTADWYKDMASSKPPKDRPWYHILVDGSDIRTYVAERNMEPDKSGEPVNHPEMTSYFSDLGSDGYIARKKGN